MYLERAFALLREAVARGAADSRAVAYLETNPRTECGCQPLALMSSFIVAPPDRFRRPMSLAVLLPARTLPATFGRLPRWRLLAPRLACRVAPLAAGASYEWIRYLRKPDCRIEVVEKDRYELLAALLCCAGMAAVLEVPEELRYDEVTSEPKPHLRIRAVEPAPRFARKLRAELSFEYEGRLVSGDEPTGGRHQLQTSDAVGVGGVQLDGPSM